MFKVCVFLICLSALCSLTAQNRGKVFVDGQLIRKYVYTDTLSQRSVTTKLLNEFWRTGYVFAGVDSVTADGLYLHKGNAIQYANPQGASSWRKLNRKISRDLDFYVNSGYPFAQVQWQWSDTLIHKTPVNYQIDKGPYMMYDSLVLLNAIKTKPKFLENALQLRDGQPYSEQAFLLLPERVARIPHLQLNRPPDVSFQGKGVWTYLDLRETPTSSFQGILGVLPNQSQGSGVLFTGNIDLQLSNLFHSGKELDFEWARFAEESQMLKVNYEHPFIVGSTWSVNGQLSLLRQDSSFLNQSFSLGFKWMLSKSWDFGTSFSQQNGSNLSRSVDRITANNWLDYSQDWYSLQLSTPKVEIIRARSYQNYNLGLSIGRRKIDRNPLLPQEVYDTVSLNLTNLKIKLKAEFQKGISATSFLYASLESEYLSGNRVPSNQLYRLGGLRTLRGFNEQFFFAQSYAVFRNEYRLFFEETSYFFAFWDQGLIYRQSWQLPYGLGGGFSLQTNSGLFSFALALGKSKDVPMDFANMKVHFGYLSRF